MTKRKALLIYAAVAFASAGLGLLGFHSLRADHISYEGDFASNEVRLQVLGDKDKGSSIDVIITPGKIVFTGLDNEAELNVASLRPLNCTGQASDAPRFRIPDTMELDHKPRTGQDASAGYLYQMLIVKSSSGKSASEIKCDISSLDTKTAFNKRQLRISHFLNMHHPEGLREYGAEIRVQPGEASEIGESIDNKPKVIYSASGEYWRPLGNFQLKADNLGNDEAVAYEWIYEDRKDLRDLLLIVIGGLVGLAGAAVLEIIKALAE